MKFSSQCLLPTDTYTYVSERWGSTSWLDHVICNDNFHNSICNLKVNYEITQAGHIPVTFDVKIDSLPVMSTQNDTTDSHYVPRIDWKNVNENQLRSYHLLTDNCSHDILAKLYTCKCSNVNCNDIGHRQFLSVIYQTAIGDLKRCGQIALGGRPRRAPRKYRKPGWSEHVADLHNEFKENFYLWRTNHKPRSGALFTRYNTSKLRFKSAIRYIKRNEGMLKADKLASSLMKKDSNGFWRAIKHLNKRKTSLPLQIGNATGESQIAETWKNHYDNLFNSVPDSADEFYHKATVSNVNNNDSFTLPQFIVAVSQLNPSKESGLDFITAEHLKFCSVSMLNVLCMIFNSFLAHGYLPKTMMDIVISPILKSKPGNICDMKNYRAIALSNTLGKVMEILILGKINVYLSTCANQFGYKKQIGTEMCLFLFKEVVNSYKKLNSSVYCCFLDAKGAFDRVNHRTLFDILSKRGVPILFLRLISYWYRNQSMCVRWGSKVSQPFNVTNGVRQGSILSPHLFNVYVDKISTELNKLSIGCKINDCVINHLFYADDICVFCPSSSGLQRLLDACFRHGSELDIIFSEDKCKVMIFKSAMFKHCSTPTFKLSNFVLKECVSFTYLGHVICNDCTDDLDIYRQCKSLYARGNSLTRAFPYSSVHVKSVLFKAYCTPMYSCQLWSSFLQSSKKKLEVAYHGAFKMMLNVPRSTRNTPLFVYNGIATCQEVLRKYVFKFWQRVLSCNNELISCYVKSKFFVDSTLYSHWRRMLFT